jgi:hypothetical protein
MIEIINKALKLLKEVLSFKWKRVNLEFLPSLGSEKESYVTT